MSSVGMPAADSLQTAALQTNRHYCNVCMQSTDITGRARGVKGLWHHHYWPAGLICKR